MVHGFWYADDFEFHAQGPGHGIQNLGMEFQALGMEFRHWAWNSNPQAWNLNSMHMALGIAFMV